MISGVSKKFCVLVLFFEAVEDIDWTQSYAVKCGGIILFGFISYLVIQFLIDRKKVNVPS